MTEQEDYDNRVFAAVQTAYNRSRARHPGMKLGYPNVDAIRGVLGLPNTKEAERPIVNALDRLRKAGRVARWDGYDWHGTWEPVGLLERLVRAIDDEKL